MSLSTFDLFKIGLGPSSSHTVGPMVAARRFALALEGTGSVGATARLSCALFGSLGATGAGHGTDKAVLLGLEGEQPDLVDPDSVEPRLRRIHEACALRLLGRHAVEMDPHRDIVMYQHQTLEFHPNGIRLTAFDRDGAAVLERTYFSVGGGFVVSLDDPGALASSSAHLAYPFSTGNELLRCCAENDLTIAQVMGRNELQWRGATVVQDGLREIWHAMQACVRRGLSTERPLPGPMKVKRRAPELHRRLLAQPATAGQDPLQVLDWVNLYALAVSEENAAGGRVVTAPTNGAAGIVPAVAHYYRDFVPGACEQGIFDYLLTAAAIGILYKENASISGAEVGCQGEVGVACSMAAGALAAVLGGSPAQVENAAEIGMEHYLGLTCDPVGGMVQIPCVERNAIAAVKAITAARMALRGDGTHVVSLDQVIKTMRETGADMKTKYKETSRGGLALNVVAC